VTVTRQTSAPLRPWTQADFRRERIGVVYALVDPRDRQIRYIGYTSLSPQERLNQHIKQARLNRGKLSYHAMNWLNSLADQGLRPEMFPLDSFVADRWQERERHWINVYRQLGCNLTNTQPGGEGGPKWSPSPLKGQPLNESHRAKISEATRRRYTDPEQRRKTAVALTGKTVSEATRDKIRKHATHCPSGHEFTEENTAFYRPGVKECRACRREKGRAAAERMRERRRAAGLTGEGKPRRRGLRCRNGHELAGENRLPGVDGKCRACRDARKSKGASTPQTDADMANAQYVAEGE
jgi:hypothetical protein